MGNTLAPGIAQTAQEAAISTLWYLQYARLCAFVSATIVLYDCICSFEREIELVWRKRWSFIKVVYLWHRYFGLSCLIFEAFALSSRHATTKFCQFWFRWYIWSDFVVVFTSEVTLILWIWVVYNKQRWLFPFLTTIFLAKIGLVAVLLAVSMPSVSAQTLVTPGDTFCVTSYPGFMFRIVWVPILAFNLFLLGMFMFKGIRASCSRESRPKFGVYHMVYRNTLFYFLAITASYISCCVIWLVADPRLAQLPVTFTMAFSITNCTRLLLNIRRAYYFGTDHAGAGLLSWSAIAGQQSVAAPRVVALPRRHVRKRSSSAFPGEIEVAVEVAVEVDSKHELHSSGTICELIDGVYELTEIKSVDR
ncbi:hypothetical protein BDW22DRAFT_1354947 [Trametopsis cervina]|nr:hypothetical protein BDW22DRAFT_1354947 [Trametopsis cervina]